MGCAGDGAGGKMSMEPSRSMSPVPVSLSVGADASDSLVDGARKYIGSSSCWRSSSRRSCLFAGHLLSSRRSVNRSRKP